jgi:hypothetical protein
MPDAPGLLDERTGAGRRWLKIIGRLRPGVDVDAAKAAASIDPTFLVRNE